MKLLIAESITHELTVYDGIKMKNTCKNFGRSVHNVKSLFDKQTG